MGQGPSAARVSLGLPGASTLFQTHRTTVVQSPHHVNETLFAALPAAERSRAAEHMLQARRFEPTDRRGCQLEPAEFALSVAVAHVGAMPVSASVLRRGMAMTVFDPRPGGYTFGFRRRGGISVSGCGGAAGGVWGPERA